MLDKKSHILLVILSLIASVLSSCSNKAPEPSFSYVPVIDNLPIPDITVQMSDSCAIYEIYLMVRFSDNHFGRNLPIMLKMTSPSGIYTKEPIQFPSDRISIEKHLKKHPGDPIRLVRTATCYDVEYLYRKDVIVPESGEWTFSFQLSDRKHIIGIGVACKQIPVVSNEQKR